MNPLLGTLTADRDYDIENTIFVAGWARSGTTWLAEVLSTIPKSAILFEPLHTERVPQAVAAGFPPAELLAPGGGTPAQRLFMERVLRGEILNWWTCSCNPLERAIRPKVWIVKEIQANYLLDWILGTFPIRRAVLIVRHPCATIASRLSQGWTPKNAEVKVKQYAALRKFPHLAALCHDLEDPFEVMAARWCIMNYVPLSLRPRPFHVVAYESLATRGARDLAPVFADWKLEMPAAIADTLGRASSTTKAEAIQGTTHNKSLGQWKKTLTRDQIARILRVVRTFGMDFYTDDLEPDYDRLNRTLVN
ncbi:MAG TPA: sulfotransferase [Vicinamibacterales bacterium]|nr:sulfotransferase [Vicinamibacterales bacterium]